MFSLFNPFRKSPQKAPPSGSGGTGSAVSPSGAALKTKNLFTLRLDNVYEGGRGYIAGRLPARNGKARRGEGKVGCEVNTENDPPSLAISTVATYEDYVAVGDVGGMTHVMQMTEEESSMVESNGSSSTCMPTGVLMYRFSSRQQCYVPQIDPLDSSELPATVTSLAFLPSVGPRPLLLTTNERTPKVYKLAQLEPPLPNCSVDSFLDTGALPRLTERRSEREVWSLQLVSRYAAQHESGIVSVTPLGVGGDQFATADYFSMRLWCTEYPDTSVETFSLLALGEDEMLLEPTEVIQTLRGFPQCPSLLFAVTSGGKVHLLDTRQSLQWGRRNGVTLDFFADVGNPIPSYSWGANLLTDCALSPGSTHLIAARDFMTVGLMDLRRSGRVRQWDLHPHLSQSHEILEQMDAYSERFQLEFLNSSTLITGGLNHHIYTIATNSQSEGGAGSEENSAGVRMFDLPKCTKATLNRIAHPNDVSDEVAVLQARSRGDEGVYERLVGHGESLHETTMRGPSIPCVSIGERQEEPYGALEEEEREVQRPWATVLSRPIYCGDRATIFVSSSEKLVQLSCKNE